MFKVIVRHDLTGKTWEEGPFETKEEAERRKRNLYRRLYVRYKKQNSLAKFSTILIKV